MAKKGYTPWNKGTPMSDISKKRLSMSLKGKKPWNKGLIGVMPTYWKGKKHSEESKKKMKLNHKGMTGKKQSKKSILKQSNTRKKLIAEGKIVIKNPFKKGHKGYKAFLGKKLSEEHRRKLVLSHMGNSGYWKGKKRTFNSKSFFKKGHTPWNKDKKHSKETIKKIKKARENHITPKKDTSIEIKIQTYLKELGVDFFTHQYMKGIEHGYQCDILIPSINMIIECDGNYWHNYPMGRGIDDIRTKELIQKGFKVLRLWEHEIKAMNLKDFEKKLRGDFHR